MMRKRRGWLLALLALSLGMSACNRGAADGPKAPVVESFTINDVASNPDTGQGLIVTKPEDLKLKATVSSQYQLDSVSILYAKVGASSYTALAPCTTSTCSRTWSVTQGDNGTYDFRVQVVDVKGDKAVVNYPASVAIAIQ